MYLTCFRVGLDSVQSHLIKKKDSFFFLLFSRLLSAVIIGNIKVIQFQTEKVNVNKYNVIIIEEVLTKISVSAAGKQSALLKDSTCLLLMGFH